MKIPNWLNVPYLINRVKCFFWGLKRETYKIRIGKIGEWYDCDIMMEIAFVEIAKKFLYDELGRIEDFPEYEFVEGGTPDHMIVPTKEHIDNVYEYCPTFYKGFRVHFEGHETQIDICKWFVDNEKLIRESYPDPYDFAGQDQFAMELNVKMIEFVENRGHMWT